jgi:hypothetical protein
MNASTRLAFSTFAAVTCGCVGGRNVNGHACIALDLRNPGLCAAMQIVDGLPVVEVESGSHTTTSPDGYFSVAIPAHATSAVLRIAAGIADRRTSLIAVPVAPADGILTPVITPTLWDTYLTALHAPPYDPSLASIHVSFTAPGGVVASASVAGAAQLLYCQGQPFEWLPQPPGDKTIALMAFGVPVDTATAALSVRSRSDEVLFDAEVPVEAGAITWVHLEP